MKLIINGDEREMPDDATVTELVQELGLAGARVAVEVNGELVPRSSHQAHVLADGDRVEVVSAIGGGSGV